MPASREEDEDLASLMNEILATESRKPPVREAPKQPEVRTSRERWFEEIFDETYFKTLPDGFYRRTLKETEFMVRALGLAKGARVLDLCCGFGRHTIELAQRGYEMAGLDLSLPLLEKALAEAQRRELSIQFIHGDMRDLNFEEAFDGIVNFHTSFGYFDDRTNFEVLGGINRALKPGGRFLIEVVNRDWVVNNVPRRIWWEGEELLFMEEISFEPRRSRLHVKRTVVDETDEPWEQYIGLRVYSLHELTGLLTMAGFDVVEVSGSCHFPGVYIGPSERQLLVLVEKPRGGTVPGLPRMR